MALIQAPPDVGIMRQRLFNLHEPINLSAEDFAKYWPCVSNVWACHSAPRGAWRCRLARNRKPKEKAPGVKHRNRAVREKQCSAACVVTHRPDGTVSIRRRTQEHTHSLDVSDQYKNKKDRQAHPDAQVHPKATGLAKATVAAHQKAQPLKLYSGWFCPFVQRAWTVLEEKKIPYQYIEVNPYHKPESLLKLNPQGLVPTLQYENKPLYESGVICEFLDEAYPDHGPRLVPEDVYTRARCRIWTDYITSRFIPSYHRFLQYQPEGEEDISGEGLKKVQQEFLGILKEFVKEMDKDGPYFLGREPMLIDFILAPWGVRMWVFDHFKGGVGIPEEGTGGEDDEVWTRWRKWVKAVEERKSIKETTSDREHYIPIYTRYAENTAQSEMAKATRAGRSVP